MKRHWYYFEKERWLAIERILEGHEYDSKHLNSLQPKKGTISDLILSDLTVKKTDKKDQEDRSFQRTSSWFRWFFSSSDFLFTVS